MKTLTQDQRYRIAEAFDIVRSVFAEIREEPGMKDRAEALDNALCVFDFMLTDGEVGKLF